MAGVVLAPDQAESVEKVATAMRRKVKSVALQGATGSGKSYIALAIIKRAMEKNSTVWFIVPRRELLKQMALTFQNFDLQHSFIAAGYEYNPYAQAHICSTGTLQGRLHKLKAPMLAVIDETHWGGEGLDKIIAWLKAAGTWIIGLTATPWKMSGQGLGCWYDEMICGPSIRWLIDNKRLSEYRAFAPDHVDLSDIKTVGGDYAKNSLGEKMENDRVLIGNAVKHYKKHADGRLNIAFCVSVKHAEIVAESFRDQGIPAAHIDGSHTDDERRAIIKAFARRELKVLSSCELLSFGFDLSSSAGMPVTVESMSDLRPTKSLALQLQKYGRVLRYKPFPALIFDHANNTDADKHGLPCTDRKWTLEDREKTGRAGGEKTLPVRQCAPAEDADGVVRGCFFCHAPAPKCPNCGRIYKIEGRDIKEVDGELSEIEIKAQRKERAMKEYECRTLEDWQKLGKQLGHKSGWAFIRFQRMKPRKKVDA